MIESQSNRPQMGIIPIVDVVFGAFAFAFFRGAVDLVVLRSPVFAFALDPFAFQLPVEPPFARRGRLV